MKTIEYYHKRRRIAYVALGNKCANCECGPPFDIDHIDPRTKTINLGGDWYNKGWWHEVITYCQLLCRSCHTKKSAEESRVRMLAIGFTHGTLYGWMKVKCKCDLCLAARHEWNGKRTEERRAVTRVSGQIRGPYNLPVEHGTKRRYSRGCRCDLCRAANTEYARQFRKPRPRGETANTKSLKDFGSGLAGANPAGGTVTNEILDDFPEPM